MKIRSNNTGVNATNGDVALLREMQLSADASMFAASTADKQVFAMESISDSAAMAIDQQASSFQGLLQAVASKMNLNKTRDAGVIACAESAATIGAFAAKAGSGFLSRQTSIEGIKGQGITYSIGGEGSPHYVGKRYDRITAVVESFDQVQQRNAALYSMAYNYVVGLQDEWQETLWPMLTLPADQIGFGIVVNRLTVWKGLLHDVTGRALPNEKVDLCRAGVSPEILSRAKNKLVPVHRAAAADKFVDTAVLTPWDYTEEGANYKTSAYATGVQINIRGLAQTDAELAAGAANQTDAIDPAVSVDDIYLKVGADLIKINIYGRHGANFVYAQQGVYEQRHLNFNSKYIVLTPDTKNVDGTAPTALAALAANNLFLALEISLGGTLNTEFSTTEVYGNRVAVVRVVDANGAVVDPATAAASDLATAIAGAKVVGYTLKAYKTNVNMRERGDLIDRNQFTQLYEVPLLSPITYQRPVGQNGENDAADFETLVTVTRFRLAGDSVTAIFDAVDRIRDYTLIPFNNEDAPSGLGAGRFHVKPFLADLSSDADAIDVQAIVSTLDSASAVKNVQAVIVNKLRDIAFSMYVMSEFQSGMKALGLSPESLVLNIATDPYLRRYLTIDGDIRTLTEKFNVKLVDTVDKRFRGLIFMSFGIYDEQRNQAPNIMNFGNLIWAPEAVVSANMNRGETLSRETIVQPRYLFVNHCPVAAIVRVKNLAKVFDQNFVRMKQI